MANIKITVEGPLMDGHKITFKAPCNCNVVEKLDVRYIDDNTQKSKLFTMKDSHGNDLTGLGNLFSQGAYVDVVLDPNSGSAYLQNAGTNGYIEQKLKIVGTPVDNLESDRADLPLSARQGKILNNSLENFGEVELLASQTSTTETTHTIKNITNYKFLYLVRIESIGNPCLCPISLFKEIGRMNTQTKAVSEDTIYGGQANYISDTSVKIKVITEGTVKLYGIK